MQDEFLRLQGLPSKTIVLITHDFAEALRVADRIAIMKDGAFEQCDIPAKIVLNPATDNVCKFTEDIENQVIMLSLAKVVLTAFIGMPGLGAKLLAMMGSFKLGRSFEIGVTIVVLAVMLDRMSKAWVVK